MNRIRKTERMKFGVMAGFLFLLSTVGTMASSPVTIKSGITRQVLVEFFTGTWCTGCPWGVAALKELQEKMRNFSIISYHGSDPMSTTDGDLYSNFVKISEVPSAIIDRTLFSGYYQLWLSREDWEAKITEASTVSPTFELTVTKTYDETARTVTLDISALTLRDLTGKYRLVVAITEDSLNYRQQISHYDTPDIYPYYHMHVFRKAITGTTGESFIESPVKKGVTLNKAYSFSLDSNIVDSQAHILVFIHENRSNNFGSVQQLVSFPVKTPNPSVAVWGNDLPKEFHLHANHPNPFNPFTRIDFSVAGESPVKISIYSILGQHMKTLMDQRCSPGKHSVSWDGRDEKGAVVSGGVYLYQMQYGSLSMTRKMLFMK